MVLFAYVSTHLANHALGLISVDAANAGRTWFLLLWRSAPGTVAFYGALIVHFGLALWALYQRRTLRIPAAELARTVLGFLIPLLLAAHFAGTRLAHELHGVNDDYARTVALMWGDGATGSRLGLIVVAWLHGCVGVHYVYRHRAAYQRFKPALAAMAAVLPVLAATGYLSMARELATGMAPERSVVASAERDQIANLIWAGSLVLLLAVLAVRLARDIWMRRKRGLLQITFPEGLVQVPRGFSVLEASRAHGLPHMSLCGGRGRCSTCRIRVQTTETELPAPDADEAATLQRISAGPDIRLACQLRPLGNIAVQPLLRTRALDTKGSGWGLPVEQEVVVLFVDLRQWTGLAEAHLPFDLVYVLERYFEAVGEAVREAGGIPNQFIGDSVMALFGIGSSVEQGAREALLAASRIAERLSVLNQAMKADFGRELIAGIGIHAGTAAVATVGFKDTRTFTAVGDAVNIASRLQELTKTLGVQLVVSEAALLHARQAVVGWETHTLVLRGRHAPIRVCALKQIPAAARPEIA